MEQKNRMRKLMISYTGSTSVIILCVSLTVILAAAFISDIGYAVVERYRLVKGTEEIAEAGAERLQNNREEAVRFIKAYSVVKFNDLNHLDVKISDNNKVITLNTGKPLEYLFLRVFGIKSKQIRANVTVKLSNASTYKGVRPFAIEKQKLAYGKVYTLYSGKEGSGGNMKTSLSVLSMKNGSYSMNIAYGYRKVLHVGDGVYASENPQMDTVRHEIELLTSKCRHNPRCTYEKYKDDCSRIIIIPVVEKLDTSGKQAMNIVGFSAFFIEDSGSEDGNLFIRGRFIRKTVKANSSDAIPDYGLSSLETIR